MYLATGAPFQSLTMEFRLASNVQCPVSTYQVMTLKTCTITPSTCHMPYNSDITINKGLTNKIFMVLCIFLLFIFQNVNSSLYQYQYHWNLHFCLKWTFYWESYFFSISVSSIQRVNHKYTSCAESYSTGLILSLIFMYQNQKISSFASLKVNWGTL